MSVFCNKTEDYNKKIGPSSFWGEISILIRHLIEYDITDEQLFSMNQQCLLQLIQSIKQTQRWKEEHGELLGDWGVNMELDIDLLNRYIYQLKIYKKEFTKIVSNEEYLVCGYIKMILSDNNITPSCIDLLILLFYSDDF